jgi:hypothetical protein
MKPAGRNGHNTSHGFVRVSFIVQKSQKTPFSIGFYALGATFQAWSADKNTSAIK